jgi:myo-inositol-1(or 4)-monophosphatase
MTRTDTPSLAQVIEWAGHAGAIAREAVNRQHDISFKGRTDLVTEVDFQCEKYLVDAIHKAFPAHSILTEEAGEVNGEHTERWYIDPLDGTVNYSRRIPFYAICIAYESDGKLQLGVVYDPTHDECFSAERGRGAWLNDEPLRITPINDIEKTLHTTAFARQDDAKFERNLRNFAHLSRYSLGVRRMGCAALELCYVACGRVDAYWEQGINAWDIAAAALIVEEAGAVVTTPEGDADYFKPEYAVLAANPGVHAQLVELFCELYDR